MMLPESLVRQLHRDVAARQARWRCTGVSAAVCRAGQPVWSGHVGAADAAGAPLGDDVAFRIGSITKTFTAVLVLQCRDAGLLDLDDPLERHLPGTPHGALTLRRMLSHLSGLQREPAGEIWMQPEGPDRAALLAGLADAEAVLPPARRWHYSNLAYTLLGEIVGRLRGGRWDEALAAHLLEPLGLTRTTLRRTAPHALGYLTDPYADRLVEEPEFPGNAFAPAGELWSTTSDLSRWGAFLADPDPAVLAPQTLDAMCMPQSMWDPEAWTLGWGLGLMLTRRGDRILVGHDGAMPGFLAGLAVRRPEKVAAVVFANTSAGADPGVLAADLALRVVDDDPQVVPPWSPGPGVPDGLEELLGVWWSEGNQFAFSVAAGRLEARGAAAPPDRPPAVFERQDTDVFRTVSGREHGELLRVIRAPDGRVAHLTWATYPVTRRPLPFGALDAAADPVRTGRTASPR